MTCYPLKHIRLKLVNQILRWLPSIIWLLVICFLSFSPLNNIPIPNFFSADKIAHIGMYFTLELFFLIPLTWNTKGFWIVTIFAVIFSLITELIQHFLVENRYGEIGDFLANLVGILIAVIIIWKKNKT